MCETPRSVDAGREGEVVGGGGESQKGGIVAARRASCGGGGDAVLVADLCMFLVC